MSSIPLLSIAIPTYNRADILDQALSRLIPQTEEFNNIEIIISDNASTDHTGDVINSWKKKTSKILNTYIQSSNTGFYGNFKRCKELARGKYVWLLSDDDHLFPETIKRIITMLITDKPDILYLNNCIKQHDFENYNCTFTKLICGEKHRLTLISSSIFMSSQTKDNIVFQEFNRSAFIGYALLVSSFNAVKKVTVLKGALFTERKGKPGGYNYYKVFVLQLHQIFQFMLSLGVPSQAIRATKRMILIRLIVKRYIYQKLYGKLDGSLSTYKFSIINKILYLYYRSYVIYWLILFPLSLLPSIKNKKLCDAKSS